MLTAEEMEAQNQQTTMSDHFSVPIAATHGKSEMSTSMVDMSIPQPNTVAPRRKLREPSVAQQPESTTKITPPYCWINT